MEITCTVLGAGQEVGKSCVLVALGDKRVLFDCGLHMGHSDHRRFPDLSRIPLHGGTLTSAIDAVLITHFHLDHCGALPYLTEVCGYQGPIYMTYPTKALVPLMLEDYRKVGVEKQGQAELFSTAQIHNSMSKVTAVDLRQVIAVDAELEIQAFYAGHVLGASMFRAAARGASVVYTGDYNMTADRHLGAAQIGRLEPDLLITESTYASTVRESTKAREREFLQGVHSCVTQGGKVLIPVFALGRAQELCILLDEYWERLGLRVPIYFSAGLTAQANVYYKMLTSWTNQKVQKAPLGRSTFDFSHVSAFDRSSIDAPGPCVLFATPGMLGGGLSLEVFKKWAPHPANMVILPGFCVAGTVGSRLQGRKRGGGVEVDKRTQVDVRCQIHQLSVSAHTDAKGIMDLIRHVSPSHVMLVHGEKPNMMILKARIVEHMGVPCTMPPNNSTTVVKAQGRIVPEVSRQCWARQVSGREWVEGRFGKGREGRREMMLGDDVRKSGGAKQTLAIDGVVVGEDEMRPRILDPCEIEALVGLHPHKLAFSCVCPLYGVREKRGREESESGVGGSESRGGEGDGDELRTGRRVEGGGSGEEGGDKRRVRMSGVFGEGCEGEEGGEGERRDGEGESCGAVEEERRKRMRRRMLDCVFSALERELGEGIMERRGESIVAGSIVLKVGERGEGEEKCGEGDKESFGEGDGVCVARMECGWDWRDEELAERVVQIIDSVRVEM